MWGLMPPPRPGSGRATPIVRSAQDLRTFVEGRCIWGLASLPCPHVNAGRLIPNSALTGIKKVQKTLKKQLRIFGKLAQRFWGVGGGVGLLAPRPRQHGMLHPKLRLTAQEKSNRKRKHSNAFSSATPIFPLQNCISIARSAQWEWPCHCRGVGAASAPTSKNLCAVF